MTRTHQPPLVSLLVVALALAAPLTTALFHHKVKVRGCMDKPRASGSVRMWDEPWEQVPDGGAVDVYYGGSVRALQHDEIWVKEWESQVDLFGTHNGTETDTDTSSVSVQVEEYLFQDWVLGGVQDEVCISDIRAETLQADGKYKLRWHFRKNFWLAGYGSDYYKEKKIDNTPCYTEMQVTGCDVTFVRDKKDGVERFVKPLGVCEKNDNASQEEEEAFPRRRLRAVRMD